MADHPAAIPADGDLGDALAAAVLGGVTDVDAVDHLMLIRRCSTADRITRQLLQRAVEQARAAGHSWAAIGSELGMSRQAAQQRFGVEQLVPEPISAATGEQRWLGPVTAFDEMRELELAGRSGWHTIGAGVLRHRMVRTDTQWEHRRVIWPASPAKLLRDGWQIGARAFPWIYLVRDTGQPVQEAATPGSAVSGTVPAAGAEAGLVTASAQAPPSPQSR